MTPEDTAGPGPTEGSGDLGHGGESIIRASWVGTGLFVVSAGLAVTVAGGFLGAYVVVSLALFLIGSAVFIVAFLRAVGRSREESIAVAELFFLVGRVPNRVRWNLLGSVGVQVVVALGAAVIRIYSATAFGTLAPMYGLGMIGLWSSIHGEFRRRNRAIDDLDEEVP